jgi:hypothetical protein
MHVRLVFDSTYACTRASKKLLKTNEGGIKMIANVENLEAVHTHTHTHK